MGVTVDSIVVELTEKELAMAMAVLSKQANETLTYPVYQKLKIAYLEHQEAKSKGDEDADNND